MKQYQPPLTAEEAGRRLRAYPALVAACRAALAYICGNGQNGTIGQHPDNWLPTLLRDALAGEKET